MVLVKSILDRVAVNTVFGAIAANTIFGAIAIAQYSLLMSALLTYGIGPILIPIVLGVTLGKNYLILGLEEMYAFWFPWIKPDTRQQPKSAHIGEFHVYLWVSTLIESLTATMVALLMPFGPLPETYVEYAFSYALFFPIMFCWELIFDFFHYWAHRMSHDGVLYKYLHKKHHKHRFPTGITTFYQDPVDLVISNSIPTMVAFGIVMGILGIPLNLFQLSLISVWKTMVEIGGHLGHVLDPASSFPQFVWLPKWLGIELYVSDHDIHHSDFNYNFAKRFGLWDRVFGTYKQSDHIKSNSPLST